MNSSSKGVIFTFDESVLTENRKIKVPINFVKDEVNIVNVLQKQLLDLKSHLSESMSKNPSNTIHSALTYSDPNIESIENVIDTITRSKSSDSLTSNLSEKIDNIIETKIKNSKSVYNNIINDTLNEVLRIQKIEKEKKEKKLREERERKILEEQKLREQQEKEERLREQQEKEKKIQEEQKLRDQKLKEQQQSQLGLGEHNLEEFSFIPNNPKLTKEINELLEYYNNLEPLYNSILNDSRVEVKNIRIKVIKVVNTNINSVANTQRQIELIVSNLAKLYNEYNEKEIKVFIIFKVLNGIINCCEENNQIYINTKSVWSYSRLLCALETHFNSSTSKTTQNSFSTNSNQSNSSLDVDLFKLYKILVIKKYNLIIIPKFYRSDSSQKLLVLYNDIFNSYKGPNSGSKTNLFEDVVIYKKMISYLNLYLSYLIVKNDFYNVWIYTVNVVNSSWDPNVFLPIVPCLIVTLLNITSHFMLNFYKIQYKKLLMNIFELYKNKLNTVTTSINQMYIEQIRQFYQSYNTKNSIEIPDGYNIKYKEEDLRDDV